MSGAGCRFTEGSAGTKVPAVFLWDGAGTSADLKGPVLRKKQEKCIRKTLRNIIYYFPWKRYNNLKAVCREQIEPGCREGTKYGKGRENGKMSVNRIIPAAAAVSLALVCACTVPAAAPDDPDSYTSAAADYELAAGNRGSLSETEIPSGVYEIHADESFVLDLENCTQRQLKSRSLQMYHDMDARQQQFYIRKTDGGYYILNTSGGLESAYLTASKFEENGQRKIEMAKEPGSRSVWTIDEKDGKYIISDTDGRCLSGGDYDSAAVTLEVPGEEDAFTWTLERVSEPRKAQPSDTDTANPYDENFGKFRGTDFTVRIHTDDRIGTKVIDTAVLNEWYAGMDLHDPKALGTKVRSYVDELAQECARLPEPFYFTTSGGETLEVDCDTGITNGIDEESLRRELMKDIREDISTEFDVTWTRKYGSLNDVKDYVEIDLSDQHVWLYRDGTVVIDTPCVSGTKGTSRETPPGVFYITYKQSPAVLTGQGYRVPVSYWMPFNGGIGLHDATFRSQFGDDIYTYDGSHGCINLPLDAAKTIYENVWEGFMVVCHQ